MKREAVNMLGREMYALYQLRESEQDSRKPYLIDLAHYRDADQFALERRLLFRERPLLLGLSSDLPEPGSVKTNDYLDVPIVMVRNRSGIVKAFANICRHRSGRLVDEPTCLGKRRSLTCRYHGWVYDLDGALKGVNHENLFGVIDKSQHGLIELPCEERHGMIFVRPSLGDPVSVDDHLGPELAAELASWDFGSMHFVNATTIDTPSNWKLQLDTFLESYHVDSLHKSTIAQLSLSGYALQKGYGHHQRMVFAAPGITRIPEVAADTLNAHRDLSIVYMIFPNIIITYGSLWVQYFEIYPGKTRDTQRTRFALYSRKKPMNDDQVKAGQDYFNLNLNFVPTEDYLMGQQTTRAVMSGIEKYQMFGHAEQTLVHFHQQLRQAIGLDPKALFYDGPL